MEWTDHGIILSVRRHGESAALLSLLTREQGRHAGLVRGGMGKGARGSLQPGNRLLVTWKARLADHLGALTWELEASSGTHWLDDPLRLAVVSSACALAEAVLPERQAHPATYDGLVALFSALSEESFVSLYIHWEIGLLSEIGYGLDLSQCAVTGVTDSLSHVSPRTGRAVSAAAAEPYRDKLLPLPAFLLSRQQGSAGELLSALRLTGHFFDRYVLGAHGKPLPAARGRLMERLSG